MDALQQIVTAMGAKFWKFNAHLCDVELVGVTQIAPSGSESYVDCDCNYENNTVCHVTKMLVSLSLLLLFPKKLISHGSHMV